MSAQDTADAWASADPDDFTLIRGCRIALIASISDEFGIDDEAAQLVVLLLPVWGFNVLTAVRIAADSSEE